MRHEHYGRGLFRLSAWPEIPVDPERPELGTRRATDHELLNLPQRWSIAAELEDGTCIADSAVVRTEFGPDTWSERGMGEPACSDQHHGHGSRYGKLPPALRAKCHRPARGKKDGPPRMRPAHRWKGERR